MRVLGALLLVCMSCADIVGLKDRQLGDDGGAPQSDASSDVVGVPDAAGPDAAPTCWPFVPSNYDPCVPSWSNFPSLGPMFVPGNMSIDTTKTGVQFGSFTILHYDFLTVQAMTTLTITGGRPAVFVLDGDAKIYGAIVVQSAGVNDAACTIPSGNDNGTNCTGGAGGGGFGLAGGASGAKCQNATPGAGSNGLADLVPLRGGCRGGNTGAAKPNGNLTVNGVSGGAGGGAIEISSKTSITIPTGGGIFANGAGASGGAAIMWNQGLCQMYGGNQNGHDCDTGGGGGGSGGAILLESVTVGVAGSACAVGGGGGGGGGHNGNGGGSGGTSVTCTPGGGGSGPMNNGGGAGGGMSPAANGSDADGSNFVSSGGGGGGLGRIHVRSVMPFVMTGATIIPAPM